MRWDAKSTSPEPNGQRWVGWSDEIQRRTRARTALAAFAVLLLAVGGLGVVQARSHRSLGGIERPLTGELERSVVSSIAKLQTRTGTVPPTRSIRDEPVQLEIADPEWAHSGYLAADTEPGEEDLFFGLSCALSADDDGWVFIRLEISSDESVTGFIERSERGFQELHQVYGVLGNSQVHLVLVNPEGSENQENWWLETESIELPDGSAIPVVPCDGH
ncbi:MAG: hypothetical protein ACN4GZ_16465 [Acidimicrobiales bacterium]